MKIVIIGDGKVGRAIVEHTVQEGHTVIVIDKNPKIIEQIVDLYDVMGVAGNGANIDIQKNAGVDKADLVVAATSSDETNILCCLVARKLGAKQTIARVRDYDYYKQIHILQEDLGLAMTLNPELEAANEIMKIINFPQVNRMDSFANGNVDLVEMFVPEGSKLIGESLYSLHKKYDVNSLVCAVQRDNEVFIPKGNFTLQAKDRIHMTTGSSEVRGFLTKMGMNVSKLKNILIIGGGKIALYLGEKLIANKYKVKIIESDQLRCQELSQLLPEATIIHGDGTDQRILEEEGIKTTDAIVSLTGIDEENIIIAMYANKMNVHKIITKVNKQSFADLLETIDVASVISPKELTAARIVSYIRALNNSRGNNVITLYKLVNNKVEALEFVAKENSKILNKKLRDLKLKDNVLIGAIIRNNEVIIPSGEDMLMLNDSVIVVTTNSYLDDLSEILA